MPCSGWWGNACDFCHAVGGGGISFGIFAMQWVVEECVWYFRHAVGGGRMPVIPIHKKSDA